MNIERIKSDLNDVFREVFENDSILIFDEMTANDVSEWDSLNHINLIVAVEKRFKVSFTTRELSSLRNVGEFIKLIRKYLPSGV